MNANASLPLAGQRMLAFTGEIYEDLELWYPKLRLIEGGFMPDKLRRDSKVLEIVRAFDDAKKPIAAICHGGWIPISADVYRGVRVTGSPGIKDDLVNAGGIYEDASVVVDGHHVSSRRPDDLPDFCRALIEVMVARMA